MFYVALRRVHLAIDFSDLNEFLTSELFPEVHTEQTPKSFAEARELFIRPLSALLTNEELPSQFIDLYSSVLKNISGFDSLQVGLGGNVFSIAAEGLNIFDGYLPSIDVLRKVVAVDKLPDSFKSISFSLQEEDGGEQEGFAASNVTIEILPEHFVWCTNNKGTNVNVILQATDDFVGSNFFVRNPSKGFTSPVKEGLVWVLENKPELNAYDKYNDFTKEAFDADTSATRPNLYFNIGFTDVKDIAFDKWVKGKYLFIKMLRAHSDENIDVEFFGVGGWDVDEAPKDEEFKVNNAGGLLDITPKLSIAEMGIDY